MAERSFSSSVTEEITNALGKDILGGRYPPGATVPGEEELCETFGAGRSAVREAVKILSAKGLVHTRPRRGTRVRGMRDWNFFDPDVLSWLRETAPARDVIVELFEMRMAFEGEAAALAATRGEPKEIDEIRRAFQAMQAAAGGAADPVTPDAAFHEAILTATGNRLFLPLSALIRTALRFSVPTTNALFGHTVGDLEAHEKVLTAIEARQPDEAREHMRRMLSEVLRKVQGARLLP
jgi:DNA-binding FadR family transcriptional regulator